MESYLLILKYIFKSKGKALPDSCNSLEEFFQSGTYFPQFVALIYDLDSIPNTTKLPKSIMAKNINNNAAFDFLTSKNSFFKNINSDFSNDKNRVNVIQSIIEKEYFKSNNKDCLSKCNQYIKQNNDTITSFSEFNNIIGYLKLFSAFMKCSVYEILIQYLKSFDIPVVINEESFKTNQDILMFQALIILKQLQEGSSPPIQTPQTNPISQQSQNNDIKCSQKIEVKEKLSTYSNLIFEIFPNSNDPFSEEKKSVSNTAINTTTAVTKEEILNKIELSKDSSRMVDIPIKVMPEEPKNDIQSKSLKLCNEVLDESQQKVVEDLKNMVNDLRRQKEELNAKLQLQDEEKKRLNQETIEKDNKLKNLTILINEKSKQIESLSSNFDKLEQSKRNIEETKKQEIEKLNNTNSKSNENLKNLQKNSESQKASLSSEIINLKKQISDLNNQKEAYGAVLKKQISNINKQKEATEAELKKQITNLNKQKELTETQLKKQINELEAKLREKSPYQNINNVECRPISELVQPLWQDKEQESVQNRDIELDQISPQNNQDHETNSPTPPKKHIQPPPFWISLPGLMNFL